MASLPLTRLDLTTSSVAEELGLVALTDIASAVSNEPQHRIIGGHMVSLHVRRWRLDLFRETADADIGVVPAAVRTPELVDRLQALGYRRFAGNRFGRAVDGLPTVDGRVPEAVVDILVPSYTSRPRQTLSFGDHLTTTEVPGLALALQRPAVDIPISFRRTDGYLVQTSVRIPDETAALALKVLTRSVRNEDKDAVDVWRCLEVCVAAGISNRDFGADTESVDRILSTDFGRGGPGIQAIRASQRLSTRATEQLETRIQALIHRILSPS